jgi:outer membrane protein assembly factor BamB
MMRPQTAQKARMMFTRLFAGAALVVAASAAVSATDWPMWGGTPSRNMVSPMTGLPTTWDIKTGKNVKWVAELGSQSYGNPVVAGGVVLVGTNNEAMRDPKQGGDRGVLMAFREETGEFLWQATFEKPAAPTTGRSRASPARRSSSAGSPISRPIAAPSSPPTCRDFTTTKTTAR